jgi:putative transposase
MEQRKQIVGSYVSQGLRVFNVCPIAGIKKSTYYYRSNGKSKGKKASTHTFKLDGSMITNDIVLEEIIDIISPEYHDYGYQVVTHQLRSRGYIINPKKVYRLMKVHKLLHNKIVKRDRQNKVYIKHTIPPLEAPFVTVEADIKYIYIHEQKRNAYLITFLCTFCRFAVVWDLSHSMRSNQIIALVMDFMNHPTVKENIDRQRLNVKIRTDNGPQFIAKNLANVLDEVKIKHEFINPGTPQENGHIESFHSTVTRLVCSKNIFSDLSHAKKTFSEFYYAYNYTRVMKALLHNSPSNFINLWKSGVIGIKRDKNNKEIFCFREKPPTLKVVDFSSEDLIGLNKSSIFDRSFINQNKISPVL